VRIPGRLRGFLYWLLVLAGVSVFTGMSISVHAQQQRIEVQLSTHRVSIDESVILSVRAYSLDKELDASALGADFDVTQRSSSRQVTIENGKRTSVVEWILELVPRRTGALEVPPVTVGTEKSRPLTLLVEQPASGTNRDLYVEASVDEIEPYVQAQVIYTLRVFQDVRFLDASLSVPDMDGALMQQLGEERTYLENVSGRNYTVSEIRYTVFPQQSGQLDIPSIILKAVVPVNRNQVPNTRTRTRSLTRRAETIRLNVRPRPDGLQGSWWLPASDVRLQSKWSEPIDSLAVDQPVTRTIHIMANGVADAQLPTLTVPDVPNMSIYADSPTTATNASEKGMMSQQTNTWAVIAQVPGKLVLPEVRVNWFDTKTGEEKVAIIPEETLEVFGPASSVAANNNNLNSGTGSTGTGDSASSGVNNTSIDNSDTDALAVQDSENLSAQNSGSQAGNATNEMANAVAGNVVAVNSRWKMIAMAFLAGWLLSLSGIWFWWRSNRRKAAGAISNQPEPETNTDRFRRRAGSRAALEPVKSACDSGDVSKIAQQVLAWGAMVWPQNPPTHISDVANRLQHPPLVALFDDLDALQYRSAGGVKPVAVESIPDLLKVAVEQYEEPENPAANTNALPAL